MPLDAGSVHHFDGCISVVVIVIIFYSCTLIILE